MLTISEIARDWGCTRQYVQQKIKQGCPRDTLENTRLWRETHVKTKFPTDPKSIQKLIEEKDDDSPEAREHRKDYLKDRVDAELPQEVTPETALMGARQAQGEAQRLLQNAMADGNVAMIAPLLAIHNKALEAMWKSEQSYREEHERLGHLIEVTQANEVARRGWEVMLARLTALPQNMAPRVNPHDPNHAMDLLQFECNAIIADVRKALRQ